MKAIMISIQPEWVAKILNGNKSIEIRKTMPKCDLPIDVYIYCTKDKKYANLINRGGFLTGMVVAKFTLNKVSEYVNGVNWKYLQKGAGSYDDFETILKPSCLTEEELSNYVEDLSFYGWHIDNLVIFDKPKELSEFKQPIDRYGKVNWNTNGNYYALLTKAPQSWCYVEVEEDD